VYRLLREQPLAILLDGGNAALDGEELEGVRIHGEIRRGFRDCLVVLGNHVREASLSAFLSDSISSSRAWILSTICSSVRARGSGRSAWFRSMPPPAAPSRNVAHSGT